MPNNFVVVDFVMLCAKLQQFITKDKAEMSFTMKIAKFWLKAIQPSTGELKWLHNIKLA